MELKDNIRRLREEKGMTQEQLANALGVTRPAVTQWESGWSQPKISTIKEMAELFGVSINAIIEGGRQADAIAKGFSPVPLLGRIAAGDPIPMEEYDDMREAPTKYKADDPNVFLLRIQGNSVNRIIKDGDFALISPKYREPNPHDLFAVCVDGHDATVKHVRMLENGLELVPDSDDPTYRPQVFDWNEDATDEVTIIGKVVWWCMAF